MEVLGNWKNGILDFWGKTVPMVSSIFHYSKIPSFPLGIWIKKVGRREPHGQDD
jgi:hypothetical protein